MHPYSDCTETVKASAEEIDSFGYARGATQASPEGGTQPYQDNSPEPGLPNAFAELLPPRPYCTDNLHHGLIVRRREQAIRLRYLQWNGPAVIRWLIHDIDRPDACLVHSECNLPEPNVVVVNRENGHAHAGYLLSVPVARHSASRLKPLQFLAAVERGILRRVGADPAYVGLIAKNPLHQHWRAYWRCRRPYELSELARWLEEDEMKPARHHEFEAGLGRNCAVFDQARRIAYRDVRIFKANGATAECWRQHVEAICSSLNQFAVPLSASEIRGIAKSISKWTWARFSPERFSALQSHRARMKYAGTMTEKESQPWKAIGISRRTYYRRKAKGQITAQSGTRH